MLGDIYIQLRKKYFRFREKAKTALRENFCRHKYEGTQFGTLMFSDIQFIVEKQCKKCERTKNVVELR